MPRLTDARKELRRAQITEAAVRCFSRSGLDRTSIADITAEAGMSVGSVYTHYRDKTELVQASARMMLAKREKDIGALAALDIPPGPDELLAHLVAGINPAEARVGVQTWGAATVDPGIHGIVVDTIDRMRAMVRGCVTAHLVKTEGLDPEDAAERAVPIAQRVQALYLAELLNAALQPQTDQPSGEGTHDE